LQQRRKGEILPLDKANALRDGGHHPSALLRRYGSMSSDFTVHPQIRAGDPFYAFGTASGDECPHGCIQGVVYLGHMVHDEETGEEVEVIEAVS